MRLLGSPLPSIDLDCLISQADWERYEVYDFIDARTIAHKHAHADSYLEVDLLEAPNKIWNSEAFYVPCRLLELTGTTPID